MLFPPLLTRLNEAMTTDSRERILEASFDLFFAGTFHNVGVTEICKAAGVNKGTLYHFFESKTDVLLGVLERYTQRVALDYERVAQSGGDPVQRLQGFVRAAKWNSARYNLENGFCPGCFIGNMSTELSASEPAVRAKAQWAMDRLISIFEPTIAEVLANAGVAGDSRKGATVFMGLLQGAQVIAKLKNDPAVFDMFAPVVADAVLSAVMASKEPGTPAAQSGAWKAAVRT